MVLVKNANKPEKKKITENRENKIRMLIKKHKKLIDYLKDK